jgi:8-oxo-dGTP pyrophosphatase MutT (NUDIX family)
MDDEDRLLLIRRSDNHAWAMPAGGLELGESIWEALIREVREETGLTVEAATPFALYTEKRFWFTNAYGGQHQMFTVAFRVDRWSGTLLGETDETVDAQFFDRSRLPDLNPIYRETLQDLDTFDGSLILR